MSDKKYTPKEAAQELLKSLHRSIAKADPALRNILSDLEDNNAKKDLPEDLGDSAVPTPVLYKQDQAKPPKLSQPAGPKIGNGPKNHVSPNIGQMAINSAPKAPSAPKPKMGMALPKSEGGLNKARVDEGLSPSDKASNRFERNKPLKTGSLSERLISGVHKPAFGENTGTSNMGAHTNNQTRKEHSKRIKEEGATIKPNLPKSESMEKARVDEGKHPEEKRWDREERHHVRTMKDGSRKGYPGLVGTSATDAEAGVHPQSANTGRHGVSDMGHAIRNKDYHETVSRLSNPSKNRHVRAFDAQAAGEDIPRFHSKEVLHQMRSMPKPNLPKSEEAGEGNLQGMGKLRSFLEQRKLKKAGQPSEYTKTGGGVNLAVNASDDHEAKEKSLQGVQVRRGDLKGAVDTAKETLAWSKQSPKPNLPKSEEGMAKTEYTPREVAIEVLKKAESILKAKKQDWDDHKVEKNKMVDPFMDETREVVNENDINEEAKMAMYNSSKKRLDSFLAKRKAKKNKKED